jgi:hypothetical protein
MFAALLGGCVPCDGEAEHAATHREYRYQLPPPHRLEANDLRLGQRAGMSPEWGGRAWARTDYPPVVRGALGVTLLFLSLPVGGYGLLYLGAIWTSDTSTGSLIMVGSLLLAIAAALIAAGVVLLRRASN